MNQTKQNIYEIYQKSFEKTGLKINLEAIGLIPLKSCEHKVLNIQKDFRLKLKVITCLNCGKIIEIGTLSKNEKFF